jgi:hypothetical protein
MAIRAGQRVGIPPALVDIFPSLSRAKLLTSIICKTTCYEQSKGAWPCIMSNSHITKVAGPLRFDGRAIFLPHSSRQPLRSACHCWPRDLFDMHPIPNFCGQQHPQSIPVVDMTRQMLTHERIHRRHAQDTILNQAKTREHGRI